MSQELLLGTFADGTIIHSVMQRISVHLLQSYYYYPILGEPTLLCVLIIIILLLCSSEKTDAINLLLTLEVRLREVHT